MKQRLLYIDLLRGLSIFLVVYFHTIMLYSSENTNQIGIAVESFNMALFFFISGYINSVVHPVERINSKKYILRKIETIIMPYVAWALLIPLYCGNLVPRSINDIFDIFWFYPNRLYWFLPVLFIFLLLYALKMHIVKYFNKSHSLLSNLIVSFIFLILLGFCGIYLMEYNLMVYCIYLTMFFLGEFLWINEKLKEYILKDYVYGISAILSLVTLYFYPINYNTDHLLAILNLLLKAVNSILVCIFFYNFFIKVQLPHWLHIALSKVGENSITIYLISFVILPLGWHVPANWPFALVNILLFVLAVFNTCLRYILGQVIYKIPYLRYILFGGQK